MIAVGATVDDLRRAVADTSPAPLRIAGAGTKRPAAAADGVSVLDVRPLQGIVAYDPAECVITARAGTPLAEIERALAAHGQYLPCDPPLAAAGATLGGLVASGWSGSCRYRYGGIRDFVIGARFVDGRGTLIASGGQVVKNAAGFLVHHGLVGSAGRLGVIVEVSLKVFPAPDARRTVVAKTSSLAEAIEAHERVRLAGLDLEALDLDAADATVRVRIAGAAGALGDRIDRACRTLGLSFEILTGDDDTRAWADAAACRWAPHPTIVKLPAAPSRLPAMLQALGPLGPCRSEVGGAVVYVSTPAPLPEIETRLGAAGWRGVIVRGADAGRVVTAADADAFDARVRAAIDPDRRFR